MYILEYLGWLCATMKKSTRKKLKIKDNDPSEEILLSKLSKDYTKIKMSDTPRPIGPYYAYNKRYLEIRGGGFENFRGIVTWVSLGFFLFPGFFLLMASMSVADFLNGYFSFSLIFELLFYFILFSAFTYGTLRYVRYVYRLELFTLRHIRVRFNRITRQVYIQRPKYCGGTVVMRWEDIYPDNLVGQTNDLDGTNLVNLIAFHPYKTGLPMGMVVGIGKNTYNAQDYRDEWEFIRRYMEEGPENLPKPWLSSLLPLPWHGIEGHIKPTIRFFRQREHYFLMPFAIPVFLVLMPFFISGYFISECLCWQPRWKKIIREAGKKGKPTPPLTTLADYPKKVQEQLYANRGTWPVRDDETGELVQYFDPFPEPKKRKPRKPRKPKTEQLDKEVK